MSTVNALAHFIAFVGMTTFMVGLFGRAGSIVYVWPLWARITARASMGAISMGHLWGAWAAETAPAHEVVLNVGLAFFWPFVAWFHWNVFLRAKEGYNPEEPPRKHYEDGPAGIKRSA